MTRKNPKKNPNPSGLTQSLGSNCKLYFRIIPPPVWPQYEEQGITYTMLLSQEGELRLLGILLYASLIELMYTFKLEFAI